MQGLVGGSTQSGTTACLSGYTVSVSHAADPGIFHLLVVCPNLAPLGNSIHSYIVSYKGWSCRRLSWCLHGMLCASSLNTDSVLPSSSDTFLPSSIETKPLKTLGSGSSALAVTVWLAVFVWSVHYCHCHSWWQLFWFKQGGGGEFTIPAVFAACSSTESSLVICWIDWNIR